MAFIMVWNVAGEFVSPKNITVGSNSASGVRNTAFHSSPSLIRMLLYPHWMSTMVNNVHPLRQLMIWLINGETFLFFFVHLFRGQ